MGGGGTIGRGNSKTRVEDDFSFGVIFVLFFGEGLGGDVNALQELLVFLRGGDWIACLLTSEEGVDTKLSVLLFDPTFLGLGLLLCFGAFLEPEGLLATPPVNLGIFRFGENTKRSQHTAHANLV